MGDVYGWARSPVRGHSSTAMVESKRYTSVTWQPRLELMLMDGAEIRGWTSVGLGSYIWILFLGWCGWWVNARFLFINGGGVVQLLAHI